MKVEQLYTSCLAQGAYYIESNGEAAIIDPLREVQQYIDLATSRNAKIKYIFETHFHADFVSGHLTLSEKTGASIIYGPLAETIFSSTIAEDGQIFELGNLKIKAIHTPGHTMESTCYLLLDESGKESALFSGDTLFLGDVGRPDLAQKAASMTQEDLAGILFESLRTKIMVLPDDVTVYPGHGAGSACGKSMSKETIGLLGEQKQSNYALRPDMTKEEFIAELTDGLLPPPAYFPLNVQMNKEGYKSIDNVLAKGKTALTPEQIEGFLKSKKVVVLDVRHQSDFSKEHVPASMFIGLDGQFAPWVGALIKDVKKPIALIAPFDRLEEAITRLSRVGFDNIVGYLDGGTEAWKESGRAFDTIQSIAADELGGVQNSPKCSIFDVRKEGEFNSGHVENAQLATLDEITDLTDLFRNNDTNYVHCAGGYRSVIALSILKKSGIHNVVDVLGGFGKIKETKIKLLEAEACTKSDS
jgi:hydroxyacylglutathione hydrolase